MIKKNQKIHYRKDYSSMNLMILIQKVTNHMMKIIQRSELKEKIKIVMRKNLETNKILHKKKFLNKNNNNMIKIFAKT